jgi:hypothetical protein
MRDFGLASTAESVGWQDQITASKCGKVTRRANHFRFTESCQAPESKIFRFRYSEIPAISPPSHPLHEGRIAIATDVGMGCGGRDARMANARIAYGEDVWS